MGGRFGTMRACTGVGVVRHHDDDISSCGAYLNAGKARRRKINRVVCSAASCDNGVASGGQIFDALICSCVGGALVTVPDGRSLVTRTEHTAPSPIGRAQDRAIVDVFFGVCDESIQ